MHKCYIIMGMHSSQNASAIPSNFGLAEAYGIYNIGCVSVCFAKPQTLIGTTMHGLYCQVLFLILTHVHVSSIYFVYFIATKLLLIYSVFYSILPGSYSEL